MTSDPTFVEYDSYFSSTGTELRRSLSACKIRGLLHRHAGNGADRIAALQQ